MDEPTSALSTADLERLARTHKRRVFRKQQSAEILRMHRSGWRMDDIAVELDCSVTRVENVIAHNVSRTLDSASRERVRAYVYDGVLDIIRAMKPKLEAGDAEAAGVMLRAYDRLAKLCGADRVNAVTDGGVEFVVRVPHVIEDSARWRLTHSPQILDAVAGSAE